MQTETILISKLLPEPKNPRKDLKPGDPEYEKIKGSIKKFGFLDPIIFNTKTKKILGGHQRLKVLVADGTKELHTIQLGAYSWAFSDMELKELTPSEEHAANIALNRIGGEWDTQRLTDLLGELKADGMDISITGFDEAEFAALLNELNNPQEPGQSVEQAHAKLADKFIVPPFSVLDTRQGYWQERKRAWIALGIKSELGRGGANPTRSDGSGNVIGGD